MNDVSQTDTNGDIPRVGIVWNQLGPYHVARVRGLIEAATGTYQIVAMEFADESGGYQWARPEMPFQLNAICPGAEGETLGFWKLFLGARRLFAARRLNVCLLPGYWPKQPLAVLLAAKTLGIRAIMMNESHAGTALAGGFGSHVKSLLLKLFSAGIVGGSPQRRHFLALGLPAARLFVGYAAIDNEYFSRRANEIRRDCEPARAKLGLPRRYFLSLGRMVEKKNLGTLIRAYARFLKTSPAAGTHLVFVGSGEMEGDLRSLCGELGLKVVDHQADGTAAPDVPSVHFYGFRQIDENPVFYALADAFVLPSVVEEWGLVVNEAMACGVPVVVSERAGCAEDLLEPGWPSLSEKRKLEISDSLERARLEGRLRQSGFVFDPGSPDELARELLMLDADPALRRAMGEAGRRIVEKFSCRNFAVNAILAVKAALGEPGVKARVSAEKIAP